MNQYKSTIQANNHTLDLPPWSCLHGLITKSSNTSFKNPEKVSQKVPRIVQHRHKLSRVSPDFTRALCGASATQWCNQCASHRIDLNDWTDWNELNDLTGVQMKANFEGWTGSQSGKEWPWCRPRNQFGHAPRSQMLWPQLRVDQMSLLPRFSNQSLQADSLSSAAVDSAIAESCRLQCPRCCPCSEQNIEHTLKPSILNQQFP